MVRRLNPETLARASSRHPWRTVTAWLLALAAAGVAAASLLGGGHAGASTGATAPAKALDPVR